MQCLLECKYFLFKKRFLIPLLLILFLSFGFGITHIAQGIDDLCRIAYVKNGSYIGFNRLFGYLTMVLLGPFGHENFFQAALGVVFLGTGALLTCVLFRRVSRDQLPDVIYTLFSCLFVSCPLNTSIWVYGDTGFMVKVSYCLIAAAMLLIDSALHNSKRTISRRYYICAVCLLIWCIGMFESAAAVFVFYVGAYLTLWGLFRNRSEATVCRIIYVGLRFALILLTAIVVLNLLTRAVAAIFQIEFATQSTQSILWFLPNRTLSQKLSHLFESIVNHYIIGGIFYFPVGMLLLGWLASIGLMILSLIKRRYAAILPILVICISPLLLTIVRGSFSYHRTCQAAAPFVAFGLSMFLVCFQRKGSTMLPMIPVAICMLLALVQGYGMDQLFRMDYARFRAEAEIMEDISHRLESTSAVDGKPVCFVSNDIYAFDYALDFPALLGKPSVSRNTLLYDKLHGRLAFVPAKLDIQEFPTPSLGWGCVTFGTHDKELHRFIEYLGYSEFHQASSAVYESVAVYSNMLPSYPDSGCIQEFDEAILVKLN